MLREARSKRDQRHSMTTAYIHLNLPSCPASLILKQAKQNLLMPNRWVDTLPPNTGLLSGVPAAEKANDVLWFWAPSVFCVREEPKSVMAPADPLCPAPKLNATAGVLPPREGDPMPKALGPVLCWVDAPKANGDGVALPNTMPLAPLFVVWVLEPKLDVVAVVAVPKEKMDVVPPNAGWLLLVPKEAWLLAPNAG